MTNIILRYRNYGKNLEDPYSIRPSPDDHFSIRSSILELPLIGIPKQSPYDHRMSAKEFPEECRDCYEHDGSLSMVEAVGCERDVDMSFDGGKTIP